MTSAACTRMTVAAISIAVLSAGAPISQASGPATTSAARPLTSLTRVAAGTVPAAKRSACQRLAGHDLAGARSVKLVSKANTIGGSDLVGCVLPRGRLRTIAQSKELDTHSDRVAIRRIVGRIVIVDLSFSDQYGRSARTDVCDVRGGACYSVAFVTSDLSGMLFGVQATEVLVTKAGRAVVALTALDGAITIAAFGLPGRRIDLDHGRATSVPVSSLRLVGNLASWTHDGQPRSADLKSAG